MSRVARALSLPLALAAVVLVASATRAPAAPEPSTSSPLSDPPVSVASQTPQPTVEAAPRRPAKRDAKRANPEPKRANPERKVSATVGATVGPPPDPLALLGVGGQGNPLAGSPFGTGGVSSFFIETYRVPPSLLPIYLSAAARYAVPWEVLAAINEVETNYGQDLAVSSAGAEGWMQFLPQSWAEYGVDATHSGVRDPYSPADAIFAAARYLSAAGAGHDLRGAIFAYNHSQVYVDSVLMRARLLAGIPAGMVNALVAIAQAHPGPAVAERSVAIPPGAASAGFTLSQWRALLQRLAALPTLRIPSTPTGASVPDRPGGVDLPPPARGAAQRLSLSPQAAASPGVISPGTSQVSGGLSFQPELGLPAEAVNMVGAAPGEAPGTVWATGAIGPVPATVGTRQLAKRTVLLRRTQGSGWQIVPVEGKDGNALAWGGAPSVTTAGGMVVASSDATQQQTIVTRERDGSFVQASAPGASGGVLETGETLFPAAGSQSTPVFTAIDDAAATGALIVPAGSSSSTGVLHYDGARWTREPICTQYAGGICTDTATGLKALSLAAGSAKGAWLLAGSESEPLMLFKRTAGSTSGHLWLQSQPPGWAPAGDKVFARSSGQMLTVTSQGVWVDAALTTPAAPNQTADLSVLLDANAPGTILGTWCFPQAACGQGSLGAPLPRRYRSFAWPGSGSGTRIVAGLANGALLRFQNTGDFQYLVGGGGNSSVDAAFASPEAGWISAAASAGANSAQVEHVTTSPTPSALAAWPLPFRRPLSAIATQPGSVPGDPGAQALAVGDRGQIARYIPNQGWSPEFLYNAAGTREEPRLRGVAWPEAGRAYAVGDGGAMWVWRADTGLWEPDPAKPLSFHANLAAIAFSPLNSRIGYAVGKQGVLLGYDKTWSRQTPPPGLAGASFTSVAFAGGEALATYRTIVGGVEVGGLLVNDGSGSGWRVDTSAQEMLAGLPDARASVLSKVAGLPDGGAVAAGPGLVIERDSGSAPWRFSSQPLPEAQNVAALAAIRGASGVQALVSVDLAAASNPNNSTNFILNIDNPPAPGFGQPGVLVGPDPLPVSGYLLRETTAGWQDLEGQAYPNVPSITNTDLPNWPDAVLALDVDPNGTRGWAVGGQTGGIVEQSAIAGAQFTSQTAAALRLGSDISPSQGASAPLALPGGQVTFAVGGHAQCAGPCADFANEGIGPDAWLSAALARAAQVHEGHDQLRAFLYTGSRVAAGSARALGAVPGGFARELTAYRGDLDSAGSLPVYVTPTPSDVDGAGGLTSFTAAMGGAAPTGTAPPGTPTPLAGSGAYAFDSSGATGTVRVVVLDFSASALAPGELAWLAAQLAQAKHSGTPAIVMGSADVVDAHAPNYDARDASALSRTLLAGGASAYLFDSVAENRAEQIGAGAAAIPALGSGTLGYVPPPAAPEEFLGAGGFLLASVNVAARNALTNRAPVTATLVPNISQLALDAVDGTLLRRSQVALFQGLARRPAGGLELAGGLGSGGEVAPDPYVPIPETCIGPSCSQFIAPSYTYTSSRPDIGDFVRQEPNNPNPHAVLQGSDKRPISDPTSGLFCAFNAGTTTVTITTGGLSYSEQVTVQAGSVQQPCGTVPLINPPVAVVSASTPVAALPPASPPPGSPAPLSVLPPPPPAPQPSPPAPPHPAPQPFFFKPLVAAPVVAAVLPPPPVLARPIPPSGTAPVTVVSPAVAPKEEQEDEEAVESARNNMAAYTPGDHYQPAGSLLALIVIAAGAGTGLRRTRRERRTRRVPALVWTPPGERRRR